MPHKSLVELEIYNALGQRIRTLIDKSQESGSYQIEWDGRNDQSHIVAAGIYVAKLHVQSREENFVDSVKMLLLK